MANRLRRLDEFKKILSHYHIATAGQGVLKATQLALLVGTTATGRDTIISHLMQTGDYYPIASDTTRQPRVNNGILEQNGREYWFRTEEEFLADLLAGKLLEAEIIHNQQVSGISIRELAKVTVLKKVAITNVDLNIKAIMTAKPDTCAFLVIPPSFKEWMRRLDGRGTMPFDEKHRRIVTAKRVYESGLEWDFFTCVINENVEDAAAMIDARVKTGKQDAEPQAEALSRLGELLEETNVWLGSHKSI